MSEKKDTKFKKGNQIWRIALERGTIGKNKLFETPNDLLQAAIEYFEWSDSNPLLEEKIFHSNGVITKDTVSHDRPYTMQGLCVYTGMGTSSWYDYKNRVEYSEVCKFIDETIYHQKYTGAASGIFNANLIARDLGIREVSDVKQEVSGTTTVHNTHEINGDAVTEYLKNKHKSKSSSGEDDE